MPKPKRPSMKTESVALAIAKRIVAEVNIENCYWPEETIEDRVYDVQQEIMRGGRPDGVFGRLWTRRTFSDTTGKVKGSPYCWEFLSQHCREIAPAIAQQERDKAVDVWKRRYGKKS